MRALVETLAEVLGPQNAFAEEVHHAHEHSIELAAVWLHFVRGGRPVALLPILCGSFGGFVAGERDPAMHEPFDAMLKALRASIGSRRALVVAAADLAHVGPAFGDPYGLDFVAGRNCATPTSGCWRRFTPATRRPFFTRSKLRVTGGGCVACRRFI